jgi:hypothetical protein
VRTATKPSWWGLYAGIALAAFAARLLPVLRGGGLFGIGHYDAAVYFGSAVALVHGRLPYRDFLLLHPPGVVLALAPFGGLALLVGDASAMAVARLAWMGLGALSAVLVVLVLRPLGLLPAGLGGLFYALFYPAVTIEQTTRLEGLAATCLLAALVLLGVASPRAGLGRRATVLAGLLIGFAATVKIWGALPLLVVAGYLLVVAGLRSLGWFAAGAVVAGLVVCLPFLLAAPGPMWRYVVVAQLDRPISDRRIWARLADLTGIGLVDNRLDGWAPVLVGIAAVVFVIGALLAVRLPEARLAVVLLVAFTVLLLTTPTWFPHYAGLSAGVAAITFGAAAHVLHRTVGPAARRAFVPVVAGAVLVAFGAQLSQAEFGEPFPGRRLAAAVAPLPGCVTADDPSALIAMDVLGRNLDRRCPLVLDLGGYSYDFRPPLVRERDPRWQRLFLDHLGTATVTIKVRYSRQFGLSRQTVREFRRWPVVYETEGYELRRPNR